MQNGAYQDTTLPVIDEDQNEYSPEDDGVEACCCEQGHCCLGILACLGCSIPALLFGWFVSAGVLHFATLQVTDSPDISGVIAGVGALLFGFAVCCCCGWRSWKWCSNRETPPCVCPVNGRCSDTCLRWWHSFLGHWVVQAVYVSITVGIFFLTSGNQCLLCASEPVKAGCPWFCDPSVLMLDRRVEEKTRMEVAKYFEKDHPHLSTWATRDLYKDYYYYGKALSSHSGKYLGNFFHPRGVNTTKVYIDFGRSLITFCCDGEINGTEFASIRDSTSISIDGLTLSAEQVVILTQTEYMRGLVLVGEYDGTYQSLLNGYVLANASFDSNSLDSVRFVSQASMVTTTTKTITTMAPTTTTSATMSTTSATTFKAKQYTRVGHAGSWQACSDKCSASRQRMPCITGGHENNALAQLVPFESAYLGFSDSATEGDWRWNSGCVSNYSNWVEGEPNDYGDGEDYAVINGFWRGYWNDIADSKEPACVCEEAVIISLCEYSCEEVIRATGNDCSKGWADACELCPNSCQSGTLLELCPDACQAVTTVTTSTATPATVQRGYFSVARVVSDTINDEEQNSFAYRANAFFTCGNLQVLVGRSAVPWSSYKVTQSEAEMCESEWYAAVLGECCAELQQSMGKEFGVDVHEHECPWICEADVGLHNANLPYEDANGEEQTATCGQVQMQFIQEAIGFNPPCSGYTENQCPNWWTTDASAEGYCAEITSDLWFACCPSHCDMLIVNILCGLLLFGVFMDLVIRVAYQSGNIIRGSSWRSFYAPLFHRLELWFLLPSLGRLIVGIAWTVEMTSKSCKVFTMFNYVMVFHRMIRLYVCMTAVTIESSAKKREEFDYKFWYDEHEQKRKQYGQRRVVRFQRCLDRWPFQSIFLFLMMLYGYLSVTVAGEEDLGDRTIRAFAMVVFVMGIAELMLRMAAQGGEVFFSIRWHKAEVCVFLILTVSLLFTYGFHDVSENANAFNCVVFFMAALCHRVSRIIGIRLGVDASGWGVLGIGDAKGYQLFQTMWGDLIEAPPANVIVKMDVDIYVSVTKAKLKPDILKDLHLPIVPCGGLVEEFEVEMKGQGPLSTLNFISRKDKDKMPTNVKVKNVLMLFVPGHGLSEAAGFTPQFGSYWNPKNVKEYKSRLVELMCKRIKAQTTTAPQEADVEKGSMASRLRQQKGRLIAGFKEKGLRFLDVYIKNVALQFEDDQSELDCGHIVAGMKIGKIHIERTVTKSVSCEIGRVSFRVETVGNASRHTDMTGESRCSFREHYLQLLRDNPQELCRELTQSNNREWRLRQLREVIDRVKHLSDQRHHRRKEFSLQRHSVFSLPRLKLTAGPNNVVQYHLTELYRKEEAIFREKFNTQIGGGYFGRARYSGVQSELSESSELWDKEWLWHVTMHPVLVSICDEQIKTLRTLSGSIKQWLLHDNALRWHPGISLKLKEAEVTEDEAGLYRIKHDGTGVNASEDATLDLTCKLSAGTIVNVLEVKHLAEADRVRGRIDRPSQGWISLLQPSTGRRWADKHRPLSPYALMSPSERRAVAQMWWIYALHGVLAWKKKRPPLFAHDLIWKAQAVRRYTSLLLDVAKRGMKGPTIVLDNLQFVSTELDELMDLQQRLSPQDIVRCRKNVLQKIVEAEALEKAKHASASESLTGNIWKAAGVVDKAKSWFSARRMEADTSIEVERAVIGRSRAGSSESVDTAESSEQNTSAPGKMLAHILRQVTGDWELHIPNVQLRLLHWNSMERPIFFKAKAVDIMFEGRFSQDSIVGRTSSYTTDSSVMPLAQAVDQLEQQMPTIPQLLQVLAPYISVVLSVDFFHVVSAGTAFRFVKVPRHVLLCTEPVILPEASHPGLEAGDCLYKPVAFALRIAPGAWEGKPACEMFWGKIHGTISDVLLLAVKRHLGALAPQDSGWYYGDGSERYASELIMDPREHYFDGFSRKSVRVGPFHSLSSTKEISELLRLKKKKAQILFQRWVRMVGRAFDCDIMMFTCGAHFTQIGSYLDSKVVVEEYTFNPFGGYVSGGSDAKNPASGSALSFQGHFFKADDDTVDSTRPSVFEFSKMDVLPPKHTLQDTLSNFMKHNGTATNGERETGMSFWDPAFWKMCFMKSGAEVTSRKSREEMDLKDESNILAETMVLASNAVNASNAQEDQPDISRSRSGFLQTNCMSIGSDVKHESGSIYIRVLSLNEKSYSRAQGESLFSRLNKEGAVRLASCGGGELQPDLTRARSAVYAGSLAQRSGHSIRRESTVEIVSSGQVDVADVLVL